MNIKKLIQLSDKTKRYRKLQYENYVFTPGEVFYLYFRLLYNSLMTERFYLSNK